MIALEANKLCVMINRRSGWKGQSTKLTGLYRASCRDLLGSQQGIYTLGQKAIMSGNGKQEKAPLDPYIMQQLVQVPKFSLGQACKITNANDKSQVLFILKSNAISCLKFYKHGVVAINVQQGVSCFSLQHNVINNAKRKW